MKVCFVYRSKGVSFSIERVFAQIRKHFGGEVEQSECYCPANSYKNPVSYLRNFLALRRHKADIFHITGVVHYAALFYPRNKTVITVHDLGHVFETKGIVGFFLRRIFAIWPLRWSKNIVAISEFSKAEIVAKTGVCADKIRVIYDPVFDTFKYSPKQIDTKCPRVLCFAHMKNKNLARHVEALKGVNCTLRVIAKLSDADKKMLEESGVRYSVACNLTDAQIVEEYRNADIVLFASTYEGFGVPILEAQSTGRPIITSNIAPMTEVAAEGSAVFVDPLDVESIRAGVLKIMNTPDLAQKLVAAGLENTKRFAPEKIAAQYAELYSQILK